ncbi:MAG TPA: hypothetical protein VGC56_10885 [Allosphingosinicella sp.]
MMKKLRFFLLALAGLVASAAAGQAVETGTAPWDTLPRARVSDALEYPLMYGWAKQLLATDSCRKAGYRPDRFNIDTRYAVLVAPDGDVRRIVIEENKACPGVDLVVGLALQGLSRTHKFHRTGEDHPRWYAGRITFSGSPQSQ